MLNGLNDAPSADDVRVAQARASMEPLAAAVSQAARHEVADLDTPDDESVAQAQAHLGPRAVAAMQAARQAAAALGHAYLGTEHLLIGLARAQDSVAARALSALPLSAETIHQRVRFIAGPGNAPVVEPAELPLSPRLRHVLVTAEHEALRRSQVEIGSIHLLVALVRERVGLAVLLLHVPGVGLERIGGEILRCVREGARD